MIMSMIMQAGITPAHAGKSIEKFTDKRWGKDHPRTRGEKLHSEVKMDITKGSPPHTRGKAFRLKNRLFQEGITPAHAGKRTG